MKKNAMMRLASVLLIAVLISTSAISGTYAKYVTTGHGSDTARVAKWGVTVEGTGSMFDKVYNGETYTDTKTGVESNVTVEATENVVAPGTEGDLAAFVLKGTPEVAVHVSYEVTSIELAGWALADGTAYCPIIFTIAGTDYYIGDTETVDAFEERIADAIAGYSRDYAPNTNLEDVKADELEVSWRWNFEGGSWSYQNDSKDTYLGNQASIGNAPTIAMTIAATVTQID